MGVKWKEMVDNYVNICLGVCVCVCVWMWEREREKEKLYVKVNEVYLDLGRGWFFYNFYYIIS